MYRDSHAIHATLHQEPIDLFIDVPVFKIKVEIAIAVKIVITTLRFHQSRLSYLMFSDSLENFS